MVGGTWPSGDTDKAGGMGKGKAPGASVPTQKDLQSGGRGWKPEGQAQGSPWLTQPGEVGWVPVCGPGSRRPAGTLASVSCCFLISGGRDRGPGLWPALYSQSNNNNSKYSLGTFCVSGIVLRFYMYHLMLLDCIKCCNSMKCLHYPHFTKAQRG